MKFSPKRQVFFPEPEIPCTHFKKTTTKYERVMFFDDDGARLARQRLNKWLRDWDISDRKDILGRLGANDDRHFDGVVWELYLNSYLKFLGFFVKRIKQTQGQSRPDYFVQRFNTAFYLEATSISDTSYRPSDSHWRALLDYLQAIENKDFYISIHPQRTSNNPPQMKKFKNAILIYLSTLDYENESKKALFEIAEEIISISDWEVRIRAIPRNNRKYDGVFIAIHGSSEPALITDLQDLREKIQEKRLKYRDLEYPFILAILENSFFASDNKWHRIGALFGQQALRVNSRGESIDIRKNDGTWDLRFGESRVAALLLQSRLDITLPEINSGELWINPKNDNLDLVKHLPLDTYWVQGDKFNKEAKLASWNAIDDPSLRSRFVRVLTRILFFKNFSESDSSRFHSI